MITLAVILAAGRGTRMAGLPTSTPKPLLPICGRSALERALHACRRAGLARALVAVGTAGTPADWSSVRVPGDLAVRFERQTDPGGIADSLHRLGPAIAEPFVLWLGDIVAGGVDLAALQQPVLAGEAGVAVAVAAEPSVERRARNFAVWMDDTGRVTGVEEKSRRADVGFKGVGLYAATPALLGACAATPPSALRGERELTDAIARCIDEGAGVVGRVVTTWDENVGTPEELRRAALAALAESGQTTWVSPGASVHAGARLQRSVIEAGARVVAPVDIVDSVVLPGAVVDAPLRSAVAAGSAA